MNKMLLLLFALVLESAHLSAQPVITNQPSSQIITYGSILYGDMSNAVFSVGVSDNGPLTYRWQFNGVDLSPRIITIAGTGSSSTSGDGGAAMLASFYQPVGLAVDATGNLFISDAEAGGNIRKIDTNGIISRVAGKSSPPWSSDGGAAINANFQTPYMLALDGNGNIFVADQLHNSVRMVGTNGIITTVAGNGTYGSGGDGGLATNANLSQPSGVAIDLIGNLFIADASGRIRKVDTNGIINTVAGNGTNGYSGDGGAATNAMLNVPISLCVDKNENLFITDYGNGCIRKVDTNGIITTVAGTGTNGYSGDGGIATAAMLKNPRDVAVDGCGNIFICDTGNSRIREVDTNGFITAVAGKGSGSFSGDGGAATNANISPFGITLDSAENLLIAGNNRIRKVTGLAPQGPNLVLENLITNNVGNYDVIVTGSDGSVTSSIVSLTLVLPPITTTLTPTNGRITISWPTYAYGTYQVEYTTNLVSPHWNNLGNSLFYSGISPSTISIQDSITTNSQRFYRVQSLQ